MANTSSGLSSHHYHDIIREEKLRMRPITTSELAKEIRIDRTKAYQTSNKPLRQKMMTLFLITSFSEWKIPLKFDILIISLVAILVVTLSAGVAVAALLSIQGGPVDPILKPINFDYTNISNDPMKVLKITVYTEDDRLKFKPKVKLAPGETLSFNPEMGPLDPNPIYGNYNVVTLYGKRTNGEPIGDPDNPGYIAVIFPAPEPGESPNKQADFLSAISSDPDGATLGVIMENTGLVKLYFKKVMLPKTDYDPNTEGLQYPIFKVNKYIAPGESLQMTFDLEDIDGNPLVIADGKKVKVKPTIKYDDGTRMKLWQKVTVT